MDASMTGDAAPETGAADTGSGVSVCPLAAPANTQTCSNVQVLGTPVVPTCSGAPLPVGQGGQVTSGRYVLQSIELFTDSCPPPTLNTGQVTWIVCGNDWATVDVFPGLDGGLVVRQFDVTASVDASALTLSVACPPTTSTANYQYTATPGHFSLIFTSNIMANGLSYSYTEEDDFALQ
jgi:hypothetical protein